MENNFLPDPVANCFKIFFLEIEKEMGIEFIRNPTEENLTSILCYILNRKSHPVFQELINCLSSKQQITYRNVDITCTNNNKKNEKKAGFDIGLILEYEHPDLNRNIKKAVLFQAKRLYQDDQKSYSWDSKYQGFTKKSEEQARKMLSITPASFFLFYNPPNLITSKVNFTAMRIIPASIMKVLDKKQPKIGNIYKFSVSLTDFMLKSFLPCLVGDSRQEIINIAIGESRDFLVNYSIYMKIGPEKSKLNLDSDSL